MTTTRSRAERQVTGERRSRVVEFRTSHADATSGVKTQSRQARGSRAQSGPRERGEMAVVAVAREIEVEAETVHPGFARPRQGQPAARRMAGVVEVRGLAAAVARQHTLDLEGGDVGDRGAAFEALDRDIDRLEFDAAEIADQILPDESRRPAGVAADDRRQRLALGRVGRLVDDAGKDPVAVGHDLARADHQREFEPVEPSAAAAAALVDAEHHHRDAVVMGRRPLRVRVDARAQIVAIAAFHVLAAHRPLRRACVRRRTARA